MNGETPEWLTHEDEFTMKAQGLDPENPRDVRYWRYLWLECCDKRFLMQRELDELSELRKEFDP